MSCCPSEKKACEPPAAPTKEPTGDTSKNYGSVQEFYASKQKTAELASAPPPCASACPLTDPFPPAVNEAMDLVHKEVKDSYFGCGLPYPGAVEGCRVLDLGSGTGRDVFLLSKLAGEKGSVVGVDMTPEMLAKSRGMIPYHAEKFGYQNVLFLQGTLEDLDKVEGLEPGSFDIIISNCVINLTKDKGLVFRHAFSLLKEGGELCFSDVYTDKPLPKEVVENKFAWNECYSGALVWEDFVRLTTEAGFLPPVTLSKSDYVAYNEELQQILDGCTFWSKTTRSFRPGARREGGKVEYLGTVVDGKDKFKWSRCKTFNTGEAVEVDADTATALASSRFAAHFKFH